MEHDEAARAGLAERYVARDLPAEEEGAFEAHFFDCQVCVRELEELLVIREGLMISQAERGRAAERVVTRRGMLTWPVPRWAGLAATVVLVSSVLTVGGLDWIEQRRTTTRLSVELGAAMSQIHELEEKVRLAEDAAKTADERASQVETRLTSPVVNVPIVELPPLLRGGGLSQPSRRARQTVPVQLPEGAGAALFVIALPTEGTSRLFRLRLLDPDGNELWAAGGLRQVRPFGELTALLPAATLEASGLTLELRSEGSGGRLGDLVDAWPLEPSKAHGRLR